MICVGIDNFYDVWSRVKTLSARWFFFGISLHLSPDLLESIEAKNGSNIEKCLYQTLSHWLRKDYNYKRFGHPSWRKLCVSVKDGGQNKALAEEIADEHLIPTSPLDLSTDYEQTPSPVSVTSDRGGGKLKYIDLIISISIIRSCSIAVFWTYCISVSNIKFKRYVNK